MKYTSTRHQSPSVSFVEALWHPKAVDGGLYMPENIPQLPTAVLQNMAGMTLDEIAFVVFRAFLEDEFTSSQIKEIVERAYNFPATLIDLDTNIALLELFGGPTLAFKDFGARATSAFLRQTANNANRPVNVFIATTGNTGSAMANALAGAPGINVFVIFPRGTAPRALENQFTTIGGNIHAIEVAGSIDACYSLVEMALNDPELNRHFVQMSLNSGNIARILGQTVYYFYAVSRVNTRDQDKKPIIVSLPSGNLGNLTAGVIAKRMGLNIDRFIACENTNNYLMRALVNDDFSPKAAVPTLAYAADKSIPTNIERILDLYGDDTRKLMHDIVPLSVSDSEIIQAITKCYDKYHYLLDPHSAMAYWGLINQINHSDNGLILATAHPAKSLTAMSAITGRPIELPLQLNRFMGRPDHRIRIKPIYTSLHHIIIENQ